MTKKDFELIARVIKREMSLITEPCPARAATAGLARLLATEIKTHNPKFDRARFLAACCVTDWNACQYPDHDKEIAKLVALG